MVSICNGFVLKSWTVEKAHPEYVVPKSIAATATNDLEFKMYFTFAFGITQETNVQSHRYQDYVRQIPVLSKKKKTDPC